MQAKRGAAGGGMFAVAMTLLFLELRVPVGVASGSPGGLPCSVQLLVCLYALYLGRAVRASALPSA
ncbi:MAG: hypothetical protein DMG42_22435 [Acidobacteria bacterium]|nr:MAG: hypothetical protein DMG42_22435 [Acidobacteriota bacterium]